MRRRKQRTPYVAAFAMLVLAGCGGGVEPYVEIARAQQANWDEMAEVLASVKDAESMAAARSRLEDLHARSEELQERRAGLPPPSQAIRERLSEHGPALQQSLRRVRQELARVRQLPGGEAFLNDVEKIARGNP